MKKPNIGDMVHYVISIDSPHLPGIVIRNRGIWMDLAVFFTPSAAIESCVGVIDDQTGKASGSWHWPEHQEVIEKVENPNWPSEELIKQHQDEPVLTPDPTDPTLDDYRRVEKERDTLVLENDVLNRELALTLGQRAERRSRVPTQGCHQSSRSCRATTQSCGRDDDASD